MSIFCFCPGTAKKTNIYSLYWPIWEFQVYISAIVFLSLYFCHCISERRVKWQDDNKCRCKEREAQWPQVVNNSRIWNDYMLCISQFTSCQSLRELQSLSMCFLTNSTMNDNPHNDISSPFKDILPKWHFLNVYSTSHLSCLACNSIPLSKIHNHAYSTENSQINQKLKNL